MKITVACIVAALVPFVATFAPGNTYRRNIAQLFAASDVPDIVKAYKKVKPEPTFPELPKIPDTPKPEPVIQYVEPAPVPAPLPELPEFKVELPIDPAASQRAAEIQSAVSDSIESVKQSIPSINLQQTADKVNAQFRGLNDFMKSTQDQFAVRAAEKGPTTVPTLGEMIQNGLTSKRATFTETTMVPEGKAPTLVEYILGGFKSPTGGISTDNLAESKAKMSMLVENTFSMFGQSAPDSVDLNLPGNMSPETAAGLAVAGVAVLVMAGQNNKNPPTPVKAIAIDGTEGDAPLSELAKDVKKMAEQIQRLSDETKSLRAELKQAEVRLTQKELDISKERLKAADMELTLKREIQKVTLQLRESEAKSLALAKELAATQDMRATLAMSLEKIQALEEQLKISSIDDIVAPAPAPVKETAPSPAKAKVTTPKAAPAPEPAPKASAKKAASPDKVAEPKPEAAPAPKPAPKASAKKTASPAKEKSPPPAPKPSPVAKGEPFFASEAPKATTSKAAAAAPAKKTTSRKKTEVKDTPSMIEVIPPKSTEASPSDTKKSKDSATKVDPVPDSENWSSLSESTLSRKTVKELMEYLNDKGVDTNDTDGKPLKKALLLEAVRSL